MMKDKLIISVILFLFTPIFLFSQNASLADHYYKNGEYEKALSIYESLYEKSNNSTYFKKIVDILKETKEYDKAKALIKNSLHKHPQNLEYHVHLGDIESTLGNSKKAEAHYRKAIKNLTNNRAQIVKLANAFSSIGLYAQTIETMEKGAELLNDEYAFAYSLAEYCRRENEKEKMVKYYLLALEEQPRRLSSIKTLMDRYLDEEDLTLVQQYIYNRISAGEDNEVFSELLSWVAIQREDYRTAFRQLRALDMRLEENGERIYKLGNIAHKAGDYKSALMAYNYIIDNKESSSAYYIPAHSAKLKTQLELAGENREALKEIDTEYDTLLTKLGKNYSTVYLMLNQARFNAFQLDDVEKSISILNEIINMRTVNKQIRAQAKILLADFLLIRGEKWDATLLYSQVDKDFPEEELGEKARFKNAMLSYFTGEYEWAKEQFDILKAATSRFYSNDAIDMSVFIADNLNLDTTAVPLQMYADAEFLLFQNKHEPALAMLDSLLNKFPNHSLEDDVKYLKGRIYADNDMYDLAIEQYSAVVNDHPDEIRADNALYNLAIIYDEIMDDKEKAQQTYEKLFMEYRGSTFAVYARKRYRELKNDFLQ